MCKYILYKYIKDIQILYICVYIFFSIAPKHGFEVLSRVPKQESWET